jgi:hypothetical protein
LQLNCSVALLNVSPKSFIWSVLIAPYLTLVTQYLPVAQPDRAPAF